MPKEATNLPFRHVDPTCSAEAFQFDDMSSIHQSIVGMDEEVSGQIENQQSRVENSSVLRNNNQCGGTLMSGHERSARRRNFFMVVTLLVFVGIVAAIGTAVVFAAQDKPIGGVAADSNNALVEELNTDKTEDESVAADSGYDTEIQIVESKGENLTSGIFDTNGESNKNDEFLLEFEEIISSTAHPTPVPSSEYTLAPTICIPLELGIIFDENADMTSWKLIEGGDGAIDGEVVWESTSFDTTTRISEAVTLKRCLPAQMYTFVFTDANGARSYVLSSEGEVIVTGVSIDSIEDVVAFQLPFEAPDDVDIDGDGIEDRLGIAMPFDSTSLEEGVSCFPFKLELQTDNAGVETIWRLFEGDNAGELIASGGPLASNSNYLVELCLPPGDYSFYIYDWASNGLCCTSGEGYYKLSSGDDTIVNATGNFGSVDSVTFTLPTTYMTPSEVPSLAPTVSRISSPDQDKPTNEKPPKENIVPAPTMMPTKSSNKKESENKIPKEDK